MLLRAQRTIVYVDPELKKYAPELFEEIVEGVWLEFLLDTHDPEYDVEQ